MQDKTKLSGALSAAPQALVLDTNVVLDLWLFDNPRLHPLRAALASGRCAWCATEALLTELHHVLQRPFASRYVPNPALRAAPDHLLPAAPPAPLRCRDAEDQKFLDLAWHLRVPLWTRDRDLLTLAKRALRDGLHIETPERGTQRWLAAPDTALT